MSDASIIPFSRFRADISKSLAKRGKHLLVAKNIRDAVQALEPLEAYFIVKELGTANAGPILKHVRAEQLQAFMDLGCWDGEVFDIKELDAWLAPFAEEGLASLAEAFSSLDSELQVLFLNRSLVIHDHDEDIPDAPENIPRIATVDTFFILDAPDAHERELHPFVLVEALYQADLNEAFKLIMAARWELPTSLEEQSYLFRNARMDELGFPPLEEALALFSPPPLKPDLKKNHAPLAIDPVTLPALYAEALTQDCLFVRALSHISQGEILTELEAELANTISAAIIAYREKPRDIEHVSEIAGRVRDTISLGLEALLKAAGKDIFAARDAAALLADWPLQYIFRHGHKIVARLRQEANLIASDPVVSHWLKHVETEKDEYSQDRMDRKFLRSLMADRPLLAGFDPINPRKRKAFGSFDEIVKAEQRLHEIEERVA